MQCEAIKRNGERCKAPAVRENTKCAGHLGLGIANGEYAKQANARSLEVRRASAEARKTSAKAVLHAKLEANATVIVQAAVDAAKQGDWRAGAWLYERVYGRPEQVSEGAQAGSIAEIAALSPDDRKALRARLVAEHPELAELIPEHERRRPTEPDQKAAGGTSGA